MRAHGVRQGFAASGQSTGVWYRCLGMAVTALDSGEALGEAIDRARAGDRQAIESVLATVAPSVYRFGLRMCRNATDAEDILQDTLMAVAGHIGEFQGRSAFTSWVFSLTRSACARRRRGLKNQPSEPESEARTAADPGPSPEVHASDRELATALAAALDGLADDYREVIVLRDVEGLTAPEAAASLGISVDALKSRLHRARESLRLALLPRLESTGVSSGGCPDVALLWSRNLEGDLNRADCAAMERHLGTCPWCSSACTALKQALMACQNVRSEAIPPAVQARVRAAMRSWSEGVTLGA